MIYTDPYNYSQHENEYLYTVPDDKYRLTTNSLLAKDIHVHKQENDGTYKVLTPGLLTFDAINSTTDRPFIIAANEENITSKLKGSSGRQGYTLPLGLGWTNGEKVTLSVIQDGIIEYRNKTGEITKSGADSINGRPTVYLGTYASIGIPLQIYEFIVQSGGQIGLKIANPKAAVVSGYIFISVNINSDYIVPYIADVGKSAITGSTKDNCLMTFVRDTKKNYRGLLAVELGAKRAEFFDPKEPVYQLGGSLKAFKVIGSTKIGSPGISKSTTFDSKGFESLSEVEDILKGLKLRSQQQQQQSSVQQNTSYKRPIVMQPGASPANPIPSKDEDVNGDIQD